MEQHLLKNYFRYTFHSVLGVVGATVYYLADAIFIAQGVGENGLAALSIALPVFGLTFGFGYMMAGGTSVQYSVLKAQGKDEEADKVFSRGLGFSILVSVLMALAGSLFSVPISHMLGASGEVFDPTNDYVKTVFIFTPMFVLNLYYMFLVRNDGAPALVMTAQLVGTFFNILFDYLLVFPMGLGMIGAALATCFSPIVSLLIMSLHKLRKKNGFHLMKNELPVFKEIGRTMRLGLPNFVVQIADGAIVFLFNFVLIRISGDQAVAAYGIIANIAIVVNCIYNGIGQGFQPIASTLFGKRELNGVKKVFSYGLITALVFTGLFLYIVFGHTHQVTAVFMQGNNPALYRMTANGLKIYASAFLFAGINLLSVQLLNAVEEAKESFIITLLRGFLVVIPFLFLLSKCFGINGVWMTIPASEMLTSLVTIILVMQAFRRLGKL